ncbi:MAG: hypothetical protein KAU99_03115 [Thermoplasmata archaeon]|nr:hypothetical protein [Thermoplasmata archaeon]MCK4455319.1 hypothetical protein [Thermoplasmata archaeon]
MSQRESCDEYAFHEGLDSNLDDGFCEHCSKYLTVYCPHIDEFFEEGFDEG